MTKAIIFQPAKNAMQSGKAKTKQWHLKYEKESANVVDELMGWQGTSDMKQELFLKFPTKEAAIQYAENENIEYILKEPKVRAIKIQSYADNFVD